MTRYSKDKIYSLLPAIYRLQDAKLGEPLEALISIIAEEVSIIENDIEDLYDNWFIETCSPWLIPYVGDSVASQILLQPTSNKFASDQRESAAIVSSRAWVANTLGYRRRKGTVAVLEHLAKDITGWNAKAIEFFKLIGVTQNINHILLKNHLLDVRNSSDLILLQTPFENAIHTIDIRSIKSQTGFYNIPNIGIFLWRIQPYPVINSPAFDHGEGKYSFNQFGIDAPLFNHPVTENDISHLAEEVNLPIILTRSLLEENFDIYYGVGKSFSIEVDGSILPANDILVENLADWKRPPLGKVALIDPILGRIRIQSDRAKADIRVNYYYGFSSDIGGGLYDRREKYYVNVVPQNIQIYRISKTLTEPGILGTLTEAITKWSSDGKPSAVFEILDSEFYEEDSISLSLPSNCTLIIRSVENQRPVLRTTQITKYQNEKHKQEQQQRQQQEQKLIKISGDKGSSVIFDGLWIDANLAISVEPGQLGLLQIVHCTLVPNKTSTSITVEKGNDELNVTIFRSISGKIHASLLCEAKFEIIDSIVDGKLDDIINENYRSSGGHKPYVTRNENISSGINRFKSVENPQNKNNEISNAIVCFNLDIQNSSIFGKVNVSIISASNTIFTDTVFARSRQGGCMRFSYIPEGSVTPRRYRCQPENDATKTNSNKMRSTKNIHPKFTSVSYGDPTYAQLHKNVDIKIFQGADNESEMGAFNNLYQPQRIKNLESALDEYLRFGMEAGTILIDLGRQNYESRYQ